MRIIVVAFNSIAALVLSLLILEACGYHGYSVTNRERFLGWIIFVLAATCSGATTTAVALWLELRSRDKTEEVR